ncbi:MAG TPA: hypothetical protein VF597_02960 [Candidatus Saccharimonadales bacterium]|jgi:5'(3')-deoxyribonucleotidase
MSVRPVIAIDCDDVLIRSTPLIVEMYNQRFGTTIKLEDAHVSGTDQWGTAEPAVVVGRMTEIQSSDEYTARAVPDADTLRILHSLALQYELHLVTARPPELELTTVTFLNEHFKDVFTSLDHVGHEGSKGEVCARIGASVLIDDNIRHLENARQHGVEHLILFGNFPWQSGDAPESIERCKDWTEVEQYFGRTIQK